MYLLPAILIVVVIAPIINNVYVLWLLWLRLQRVLVVLLRSRPSSSVLSRLQAIDNRDVPVMWPCGSVQGPGQSNGGEGIDE